MPRSEIGERGLPGTPVAGVGQYHHVGLQQLAVAGKELAEVLGGGLLLALHEHRHPDGRLSVPGPNRSRVHDDARLVVGGASAEQPAVPLDRLVGVGGPQAPGPLRLDVVVGVQQDGGGAGRSGEPPDHGRVGTLDLQDLGLRAEVGQELLRGFAGGADVGRIELREAHGRDADQPLEIRADGRELLGDRLGQVGAKVVAHGGSLSLPGRTRRGAQVVVRAAARIWAIGVLPNRAASISSSNSCRACRPEVTATTTYSPELGMPTCRVGPKPGAATT